jgi:hypothetical protein
LRLWLAEHHADRGPVRRATGRKHHPGALAQEPQVEELLCWGWTDSVTPAPDRDRAMTPAARARVEAAKPAGSGISAVMRK